MDEAGDGDVPHGDFALTGADATRRWANGVCEMYVVRWSVPAATATPDATMAALIPKRRTARTKAARAEVVHLIGMTDFTQCDEHSAACAFGEAASEPSRNEYLRGRARCY